MQIREVQQRTGLTKKAIRYYEENGLIITSRKENGYKEYSQETVDILLKIKQLRLLDFTVEEINRYQQNDNRKEILNRKIQENAEKINEFSLIKSELEKMIQAETNLDRTVENALLNKKKKNEKSIQRYNLILASVSLIAYIIIFIAIVLNADRIIDTRYNTMLMVSAMFTCSIASFISAWIQRKKKQAKAQGILLLRYKPIESILVFLISCVLSTELGLLSADCLFYVKKDLARGYLDLYVGNLQSAYVFIGIAIILGIGLFFGIVFERGEFN